MTHETPPCKLLRSSPPLRPFYLSFLSASVQPSAVELRSPCGDLALHFDDFASDEAECIHSDDEENRRGGAGGGLGGGGGAG